ncbi:MAG: ABC-2 transporter permease [Patescibacteria group bacterium]|jgi:ABC-2 type transport system permease protein
MKKISIIAQKEIAFYLNNPLGYVIAGLFLIISTFLFFNDFFITGVVSQKGFFAVVPWIMIFFIVGLTMRTFSEEKRLNTIELWLTFPVSEFELVMGKFVGLAVIVGGTLLLTVGISMSLFLFGKPFIPEIVVNYIGLYFFALLLIALGNLLSLLSNNQIVALLTTVTVFIVATLIGTDTFTRYVPNVIGDIFTYVSPLYHLSIFSRGVIAARSLLYFLSNIGLFLGLTVVILRYRK